jgi:hypothetical protein
MNNSIIRISFFILIACAACRQSAQYQPETYLSTAEQEQFLKKIARYTAKVPRRVTHEDKYNARYDAYYSEEMKKYDVRRYYISPDSTHYFLITRPAPSLREKRVAIGGRLKYGHQGSITFYEEVFRTWKMEQEELTRKGETLFSTMVETGNVNAYLPGKREDDWVEFPDGKSYFDVGTRRWKVAGQSDSVYYQTF